MTTESLGANGADDMVNFESYVGAQGASTDNIMAVATTYVENTTDEPMTVFICTASDDSIRVDINNYNATLVSACRGSAGDCQDTSCGVLEPGVNKITAYVWEGGGGWNMRVGLRNIAGQILNDRDGDVVFLGTGEEDGTDAPCVPFRSNRVKSAKNPVGHQVAS